MSFIVELDVIVIHRYEVYDGTPKKRLGGGGGGERMENKNIVLIMSSFGYLLKLQAPMYLFLLSSSSSCYIIFCAEVLFFI